MDKLVVEGQKTVSFASTAASISFSHTTQGKQTGNDGGIVRQKDTG